jgi:hypothetical protein
MTYKGEFENEGGHSKLPEILTPLDQAAWLEARGRALAVHGEILAEGARRWAENPSDCLTGDFIRRKNEKILDNQIRKLETLVDPLPSAPIMVEPAAHANRGA